jgi:predicted nucleic acid-binding protein
MKSVFVDTSYWIAIVDPTDNLHDRALTLQNELANIPLITSEMVLCRRPALNLQRLCIFMRNSLIKNGVILIALLT